MTTGRKASRHRGRAERGKVLVAYGDTAFSPEWGFWRGTFDGDATGKTEFHERPENFETDGVEY